ncbi:MAG: amidase, partial [Gemmatimonadales bacterium]
MNTRRQFLIQAPVTLLAVASACRESQHPAAPSGAAGTAAPGAPPTFGTAAGSGPPVTPATFAEAEKLVQVTLTGAQLQQASDSWRGAMSPYFERRTGPRKLALAATDLPGMIWNPMLPGVPSGP